MSCSKPSSSTSSCTESTQSSPCGKAQASIALVHESGANALVDAVFADIKKTLGIDFVPNMYRAMANNPAYLDHSWKRIQAVMGQDGRLGRKTKDIVALTVCIMSGCEYCIDVYNNAVRHGGLDDEAMLELYNVIDVYSGLNRLNIGLQLQRDEKPWNGCGG